MKSITQAFDKHLSEVSELFAKGSGRYNTETEAEFIDNIFPICKNISIDYGIMEKADNVYVLAADFGWSDLGTWGSLFDIREKDEHNNAVMGKNVMTFNSSQNIVNMPREKLVVLQGLKDYIVAEDDGILLICKKQDEQHIREIVNAVKLEKGDQYV
jgi:mannose-1-phosphate guanylyltransferase